MFVIFLILSQFCADPTSVRAGTGAAVRKVNDTAWHTGAKLDEALRQPVIATWQNAELREILKALGDQRRVAIVLDRRLDPNHKFTFESTSDNLHDVLAKLAEGVGGSVSVTGQTVYLGPLDSTAKLRTLLTLRQEELKQLATQLPASRRSGLTGQKQLLWDDLESPSEIVRRIVQDRDAKLVLRGETLVPHDLWAAGTTPSISLAEALTLVLIQFDLTYQLDPSGSGIEILAIPDKVAIERRFPLPKAKAAEISKAVRIEAPRVETQATPEQLIAIGTQEQLEELERIIRSVSSGTTTTKKTAKPAPLSKRRITFQAKDVPLKAILDKLATTGIEFNYDQEALKKRGINIEQLVEIDVKDAKVEELFDKLFDPLGIVYEVQGLTVKLEAGEKMK